MGGFGLRRSTVQSVSDVLLFNSIIAKVFCCKAGAGKTTMKKRVTSSDRRHTTVASVEPPPSPRKPKLEKVTRYLRPEQVVHIEEIQLQQRRRTGKRPDK